MALNGPTLAYANFQNNFVSSNYDIFGGIGLLTLRSLNIADKAIFMPEIQVIFRKQRIQIQHPSQSHDTYFQGTGTGVVQARLTRDRNRSRVTSRERESEQVSFKIPGLELGRTWYTLPRTAAETRATRAFYSKTESKSQLGYFPEPVLDPSTCL